MIEWAHEGGVEFWYEPSGQELTLSFCRETPDAFGGGDQTETRWAELCAQNPKLFDGPISTVTSFDPASMRIGWSQGSYKMLAVQSQVDTRTWQLSVTALLVAGQTRSVLIGKRSEHVHTYPGLWEFGPSGGVDPPAGEIERAYVLSEVHREMREEIGLEHSMADARIVGVFRDSHVRSYDVLVRVPVEQEVVLASDDWEYDDMRWLPPDQLASMQGLCPPSAVVGSQLGSLI